MTVSKSVTKQNSLSLIRKDIFELLKVKNNVWPNVSHLVVNVIWAQPPYDHADKRGTNGNSLKVALWVVGWPFGSRLAGVACAAEELAYVVKVGVGWWPGGTNENVKQYSAF